jgi:hypothetical protein
MSGIGPIMEIGTPPQEAAKQLGLQRTSLSYLSADPTKRFPKYFDSLSVQHFFPVFGHNDQRDVHIENAMSSGSNLVVFLHRPKYNSPYEVARQGSQGGIR